MEKGNQWCISTSRLLWVFCTEVTVGLHTRDAAVERKLTLCHLPQHDWGVGERAPHDVENVNHFCPSVCLWFSEQVSVNEQLRTIIVNILPRQWRQQGQRPLEDVPLQSVQQLQWLLACCRYTSTTRHEILCRTYECHCQWDYNGVAGANSCVCRILTCRNLHARTKEIPSNTGKPSREGWVIWVRFVWLSLLAECQRSKPHKRLL